MEIRSTRSFNAIPATIIRGVFSLYVSNLFRKMYCKYFIYFFIYHLNIANFFLVRGKYILTYLFPSTRVSYFFSDLKVEFLISSFL